MGDRAVVGPPLRTVQINVEPLVVAGGVGELVHLILGDVMRLAFAKRLADMIFEIVDRIHEWPARIRALGDSVGSRRSDGAQCGVHSPSNNRATYPDLHRPTAPLNTSRTKDLRAMVGVSHAALIARTHQSGRRNAQYGMARTR